MKKLTQILETIINVLNNIISYVFPSRTKNKHAEEIEKAWITYIKSKDANMQESDNQRKLLYGFMHHHREKDLN